MAANTEKKSGLKGWIKSRKGQQFIIGVCFMIIPLLLLFTFTYLPFGKMVQYSFYKFKYSTPRDNWKWMGWQNYIDVFKKPEVFGSLKLSLYYMV